MILFNKCLKNTIKQYVLSISVVHAFSAVQSLLPLPVASSKSECALLSAIFCMITLPLLCDAVEHRCSLAILLTSIKSIWLELKYPLLVKIPSNSDQPLIS